jgi:nitrous oxide reductase accessory protein NosL
MSDAQAFVAKEGGQVVRFDELSVDMLDTVGSAHDSTMGAH